MNIQKQLQVDDSTITETEISVHDKEGQSTKWTDQLGIHCTESEYDQQSEIPEQKPRE